MRYGFITSGGATYYFGEDGSAVTGEVEIDGVLYVFDENGKKIN